jgi:flagellum-specific peptidoglycan hydrolase FlgJ
MKKTFKIILTIVFTFAFVSVFNTLAKVYKSTPTTNSESNEEPRSMSLEDSIAYEIKRLDFKYPHIVLAQAKQESAHFRSKLFVNNNNMFGMKMPTRRPTTAVKQKSSYAYYDTWVHSIIDQKIYYTLYLEHRTEEQVYAYLSKYYAEDPNYVKSLKRIIEREKLKEKF